MAIEEKEYKADMTLLEKYQGFSGELLRISFAGIALLAFFFEKGATAAVFPLWSRQCVLVTLGIAAFVFALAAAASLAHRFYSNEEMYYRLKQLHKGQPIDPRSEPATSQPVVERGTSQPAVEQVPDRLRKFLAWKGYVDRVDYRDHAGMRRTSNAIAWMSLGLAASLAAIAFLIVMIAFLFATIGFLVQN